MTNEPVPDEVVRLFLMNLDELDDEVHTAKGAEAAEINNSGRIYQIAYLMMVDIERALEWERQLAVDNKETE